MRFLSFLGNLTFSGTSFYVSVLQLGYLRNSCGFGDLVMLEIIVYLEFSAQLAGWLPDFHKYLLRLSLYLSHLL